jgi:DNA-binding transcriptional ArsR family regulator
MDSGGSTIGVTGVEGAIAGKSVQVEDMRAIAVLSALAQPTRMHVFRLLVRAGEEGLSSGDLALQAGAAPNTMSSHLAVLSRAGLVRVARSGRHAIYSADALKVHELCTFLIEEICSSDQA